MDAGPCPLTPGPALDHPPHPPPAAAPARPAAGRGQAEQQRAAAPAGRPGGGGRPARHHRHALWPTSRPGRRHRTGLADRRDRPAAPMPLLTRRANALKQELQAAPDRLPRSTWPTCAGLTSSASWPPRWPSCWRARATTCAASNCAPTRGASNGRPWATDHEPAAVPARPAAARAMRAGGISSACRPRCSFCTARPRSAKPWPRPAPSASGSTSPPSCAKWPANAPYAGIENVQAQGCESACRPWPTAQARRRAHPSAHQRAALPCARQPHHIDALGHRV